VFILGWVNISRVIFVVSGPKALQPADLEYTLSFRLTSGNFNFTGQKSPN